MPVVVLVGLVGMAACAPSVEECTAADAAQQYAQSLPVATKARAGELASSVEGVKEIRNDLEIRQK